MAFRGYHKAKQTQRSKNKTNTSQTSNKNKKTNKKKNNKTNKKNRQQTQDKNTDCCSKPPPQKSWRGESGRTLFSLYFVGDGEVALRQKPYKGKNGSQKLGSWKGPKIHNSFWAYKTSGFVRSWKTLRTEEAPTQKVYKKMLTIWLPIWGLASQKRQNTLRFKRNFRNSRLSQLGVSK